MTRPILIFGAGGQVGQALQEAAQLADIHVVPVARFPGDVTSHTLVTGLIEHVEPSAVINCAVYRGVDQAETDRKRAEAVNIDGVINLQLACAENGAALVHLSSDYVFAGTASSPYVETDLPMPETFFGATKFLGEAYAKRLHQHLVIRASYVYGPYGGNFLKSLLAKAEAGEELRVVNDQVGTPTHTEDLARAILAATERVIEDPSVSGTYHFAGSDFPCSWWQFAREIVEAAGFKSNVTAISTAESGAPAKRPAYSALDSSLFYKTFDIRAEPRAKRIRETIAALRA